MNDNFKLVISFLLGLLFASHSIAQESVQKVPNVFCHVPNCFARSGREIPNSQSIIDSVTLPIIASHPVTLPHSPVCNNGTCTTSWNPTFQFVDSTPVVGNSYSWLSDSPVVSPAVIWNQPTITNNATRTLRLTPLRLLRYRSNSKRK